jgi:hypothetical protein
MTHDLRALRTFACGDRVCPSDVAGSVNSWPPRQPPPHVGGCSHAAVAWMDDLNLVFETAHGAWKFPFAS